MQALGSKTDRRRATPTNDASAPSHLLTRADKEHRSNRTLPAQQPSKSAKLARRTNCGVTGIWNPGSTAAKEFLADGADCVAAMVQRCSASMVGRGGNCSSITARYRHPMSQRFDFTSLELFVAVCEAKSIARAAEAAHIAPSAVSKRIAQMERLAGAALLVRSHAGVTPTRTGLMLLQHARHVLYNLDLIERDLRGDSRHRRRPSSRFG